MSNNGTDNPQDPSHEPAEFDEALDSFQKVERARRRKLGILVLLAFLGVGAVFVVAVVYRGELFGSGVDVEQIDSDIAARTNDPQCRDMIAEITRLGEDFFKLEPQIDADVLGDDTAAIAEIRDEISRMQQRLDEISEASQQANLRYEESRDQLDDWFEYVALELSFVDRLATERLAELKAENSPDTPDEAKNGDKKDDSTAEKADKPADDEAGVVLVKGEKGEPASSDKEKKANQKTPLERKRAALVALHDSFQKFRIWHTAGAHPCGAAAEGEEPWKPTAADTPAAE